MQEKHPVGGVQTDDPRGGPVRRFHAVDIRPTIGNQPTLALSVM